MATRVLIMAGGTGGHVFPALAVAQALKARGATVNWLGTPYGIEADIVPKHGIELLLVQVRGLRGQSWRRLVSAPWVLARAFLQALRHVRDFKPDVVLGMGGFVTGPGGMAAWTSRVPLIIHEQNAIPGMTNKWLSRIARRVCLAFPGAIRSDKSIVTGNPIREDIMDVLMPETRLHDRQDKLNVLILGGSQGAVAINDVLPEALSQLSAEELASIVVRHQVGPRNLDQARKRYEQFGIVSADITAFIDNMSEAYAWADLVICRSGALTVSELAAAGVAAILVPYPHAVDDHQTVNGQYLAEHSAALIRQQHDLSSEWVAQQLRHYLHNREELNAMAKNARELARPKATETVVDLLLEAAL